MRARKRGERWQSEAGDQGKGWAVAGGGQSMRRPAARASLTVGEAQTREPHWHFQDKQER